MKATPADVPLDHIVQHPSYVDMAAIEQHILTEYMLVCSGHTKTVPIIHLKKDAIDALLEIHPIQVISGKKDRYYCIGGIRTLSIARNCLPPSEMIPVVVLSDIKKKEARERCLIDVFLTSCLSLRNIESLHRIITLLPEDIIKKLITVDTGTVGMAKLLGVERETIRLWNLK